MAIPNRLDAGNGQTMTTAASRRARAKRRRTTAGIRSGAAGGGAIEQHPSLATQELRRAYQLGAKHACEILNVQVPTGMFTTRT
jgi:hypothetical protein